MAGPASRSRLASRCQQNTGQRTDARPVGPARGPPSRLRGPDARRRARDFGPLAAVLGHLHLVGLGRFERPTSRLSGVRSDQLSYRPPQRSKSRGQRSEGPARQASPRPPPDLRSPLSDLCTGRDAWTAARAAVADGPDAPCPNARAFLTSDIGHPTSAAQHAARPLERR